AYEKNQALKILKRIFGYFLGACKKLPAQQSGIKVGNTKLLRSGKYPLKNQRNDPILTFPWKKGEGTEPRYAERKRTSFERFFKSPTPRCANH
ncbi:hypothetical protein, partial [Marinomonas polaris]|uniref:hypothetical protein n=1 Tax=Marinomonas polaris TaxID=293552 RepID=UPI001C31663D